MNTLETDYLIIGAGTAGLAFADTLLSETDAHITIVDRHGKPGGHWNDAYGFVTLHQPSAFYGVNSMELGSGRIDTVGLNQGFYEQASGAEVCGYFDRVMQQRLLPSGRVSYHPLCNEVEDGVFESLLSGERTQVRVRRKRVDARYYSPFVPSTHRRRFSVGSGATVVPPNALPGLWSVLGTGDDAPPPVPAAFVVLGAGKTAMDTIIWLIGCGVDPDAIHWVMPRDAWLINRATTQPGMAFFEQVFGSQADQMQAFAEASSVEDLFLRLERCGALMRIFPDHLPTMFHLATVAPAEVEVLRRVRKVLRQGRVSAVEPGRLLFANGTQAEVPQGALFIDCTASAVEPRTPQPIFQGDRIVLQMVRLPQPAFSAALIAWVEAHHGDDATGNRLCATVPFPHQMAGYPLAMLVNMGNQAQWGQDKGLRTWVRESRLDGFGKLMGQVDPADGAKLAILGRFKDLAPAAVANLRRLAGAART